MTRRGGAAAGSSPLFGAAQQGVCGGGVGRLEESEHRQVVAVRFVVQPVVDRVFTFDQAREAYRHMESGSHFGKVVIAVT